MGFENSFTAFATGIGDTLSGVGVLIALGAGDGFKETLIESGVGGVIGEGIASSGIMAPLAAGLPSGEVALLVLAIGAGSVFPSHVNDAGFWLVKEYFRMTVGQTFKTWSLMECAVSVAGPAGVLVLGLIV
jgi:GntP family gluconate:H+ symporter